MQSVFRWPIESCHERETFLKLNFFQLMERHRSWGSVLISMYLIDARDLKIEMRMRQSNEKTLYFEVWFQFDYKWLFDLQWPS